jgi:hypothetical protein
MDGYFGDPSTKVLRTNVRSFVRTQAKALEVYSGLCDIRMRVETKSLLPSPGERDIELYGQVWPNFDWVRGGEAPGLCGAKCLTGCKEVTGLDGWSSRNMWRPCVWPPSILIKH